VNSCVKCSDQINPGNQCPESGKSLHYFAQVVINDTLIIPPQKPDVEMITNITKNFKILSAEERIKNLGSLQGKEVMISGILTLGIEYSAAVPSQEVHFAHFDIPFKALIKYRPCDCTNRGLIVDPTFCLSDYHIKICVEHEQYHLLSPREISKVLVVLIWLDKK
jgi:hypothetical protein